MGGAMAPLEIGAETPSTTPSLEFTEPIDYPPSRNLAGKLRQLPPPPLEFTEPIDYPPPLEIGPENSVNYPPSNSRNPSTTPPPRNRAEKLRQLPPPPLEFTAGTEIGPPPQIKFLDPPTEWNNLSPSRLRHARAIYRGIQNQTKNSSFSNLIRILVTVHWTLM